MTTKHICCDLDETVIQGSKGGRSEQMGFKSEIVIVIVIVM